MAKYNNTELTEIKKQIFPRYIGQKVKTKYFDEPVEAYLTGIHGEHGAEVQIIEDGNVLEHPEYIEYSGIIQLIPLSSITTDIATDLVKLISHVYQNVTIMGYPYGIYKDTLEIGFGYEFQYESSSRKRTKHMTWLALNGKQLQYLQLKGYATEQTILLDDKIVTISVDEQVELGIIELIKQ